MQLGLPEGNCWHPTLKARATVFPEGDNVIYSPNTPNYFPQTEKSPRPIVLIDKYTMYKQIIVLMG